MRLICSSLISNIRGYNDMLATYPNLRWFYPASPSAPMLPFPKVEGLISTKIIWIKVFIINRSAE